MLCRVRGWASGASGVSGESGVSGASGGDDGDTLTAGYEFGGTGGPGGNFDWRVTQLPGSGATILNTSFSVIQNEAQTATQTIVNGQVDVRNLTIDQGGILEIRGPNPCVIRASGDVIINGKIKIRGVSNRGVVTFNTTSLPETGVGLPGIYLIWLLVLVLLYPICRWFAGLKQRGSGWWWSYL